jgi:glycosyltransferase involved in cell wall biosynthesis
MPKFSIIIPTYNRKELLKERALKSLLNQTYKDFEVIVINDGGEDVSDVIEEYKDKGLDIKYISYKGNKGPSYARNRGLEIAQGEWIGFLDDDDEYFPTALETFDHYTTENFKYIITLVIKKMGNKEFILPFVKPYEKITEKAFAKWIVKWWLVTVNLLIRKNLLVDLNGFDERLRIGEDTELWLRILFNTNFTKEGKFIPVCTYVHYFKADLGNEFAIQRSIENINYILEKHKKNLKEKGLLKDFYYRLGIMYLWKGDRKNAFKFLILSLPKYHIKSILRIFLLFLPNNWWSAIEKIVLYFKIKRFKNYTS